MRSAEEHVRGKGARLAGAVLGAAAVVCALTIRAEAGAATAGGKVAVCESRAILELRPSRPGEKVDAEREARAVRIDMLTWSAVRDIVVSGKVDLGVKIDPDDRQQVERVCREIRGRTRVRAASYRHIEVAARGPDPEQNASLVNEMVKRFVGEHRSKTQDRAKAEVHFLTERLTGARAHLREVKKRAAKDTRHEAAAVEEVSKALREAEQRLHRLMSAGYAGQFVVLEYARGDRTPVGAVTPRPAAPVRLEPVTVEALQKGDLIFSQLDRNGFVTSISHFFRELGPDPKDAQKGFTIQRTDADRGTVELYRLRNVGTGEVREFRSVGVIRLPDGRWSIGQAGWKQIEKELARLMRVQLRKISRD